jgi:hypothetical protein
VAYDVLRQQMKTKHAQIRIACLQLLVILYERAQFARKLVHEDLHDWITLTVGLHGEVLPPPQAHAQRLKQLMLTTIHDWYKKRGDRCRQVSLDMHWVA